MFWLRSDFKTFTNLLLSGKDQADIVSRITFAKTEGFIQSSANFRNQLPFEVTHETLNSQQRPPLLGLVTSGISIILQYASGPLIS
jgi:hypothetical protein